MLVKLYLKNSPKTVTIDDFTYEFLTTNEYFKNVDFIHNLREHSIGYAVFQKTWKKADGTYKTETIYLHKLVAEKFIERPSEDDKKYVMVKNENKLDCRVENLQWGSRSNIVRNRKKNHNKTGFIGVFKDRNKFAAKIYVSGHAINLGRFDTPEEAAAAYNLKSEELFGKTRNLNKLTEKGA